MAPEWLRWWWWWWIVITGGGNRSINESSDLLMMTVMVIFLVIGRTKLSVAGESGKEGRSRRKKYSRFNCKWQKSNSNWLMKKRRMIYWLKQLENQVALASSPDKQALRSLCCEDFVTATQSLTSGLCLPWVASFWTKLSGFPGLHLPIDIPLWKEAAPLQSQDTQSPRVCSHWPIFYHMSI